MDSFKAFFLGQNKDVNNQPQGNINLFSARTMQNNNNNHNLTNGANDNPTGKITNHYEAKRKDSDSYFYIMWRS